MKNLVNAIVKPYIYELGLEKAIVAGNELHYVWHPISNRISNTHREVTIPS
jgi:hypothetical protein